MDPKISIIIRTFNEEKDIGACLKKIFLQKIEEPFEVIIIDSGSTDNTLKIAKTYPVKIYSIQKENFSFGKSLNYGCTNAKGDLIISISAHAIPVSNLWLKKLVTPLENSKVAGSYGREIPKQNANPMEARKKLGTFSTEDILQKNRFFFSNANSCFRKKLWLNNKFDESFKSAEDNSWANKIMKKGYFIYYKSDAIIYHSHNYSLKQNFLKSRNQIYYGHKIIEKKNSFYIIIKGLMNFFYCVIADLIFIFKNKYKFFWVFYVIPHETSVLLAFLSAALRPSPYKY
jgi:rhamnosyltransferase